MTTWATVEGSSTPLGATWIAEEQAYNFALYSSNASGVTLLLYAPEDLATPSFSYEFDSLRNKTGPVWHTRISKSRMPTARYYAYSIDGSPPQAGHFNFFQPRKVLVDPYARAVFFPRTSTARLPWVRRETPARLRSAYCPRRKLSTGALIAIHGTTATLSYMNYTSVDSP